MPTLSRVRIVGTSRRRVLARAARVGAWTVITACLTAFAASTAVPLWFGAQGQRLLVVTSGSMAPLLQAGDAVVIQAITDPSRLQVGQVATFWPPGGDRLVTHRIVDLKMLPDVVADPVTGQMVPRLDADGLPVERPFILTKGDANATQDPNATPLSRVRGVVLAAHAGWGRVIGWAHSPLGRLEMIGPPLVLLALLELVDAVGERRRGGGGQGGGSSGSTSARDGRLDAILLD